METYEFVLICHVAIWVGKIYETGHYCYPMLGFSTHFLERDPRKVCLGLLEVLNKLYGNIVIPEAVKTELEVGQNNLSIRLFKS